MSDDLRDRLADLIRYIYTQVDNDCGVDPVMRPHAAYLADALLPLVREAQAEAWGLATLQQQLAALCRDAGHDDTDGVRRIDADAVEDLLSQPAPDADSRAPVRGGMQGAAQTAGRVANHRSGLARVEVARAWDEGYARAVEDSIAGPIGRNPYQHLISHDCKTCVDCIHDGRKCCGCYDGACCMEVQS